MGKSVMMDILIMTIDDCHEHLRPSLGEHQYAIDVMRSFVMHEIQPALSTDVPNVTPQPSEREKSPYLALIRAWLLNLSKQVANLVHSALLRTPRAFSRLVVWPPRALLWHLKLCSQAAAPSR